MFDTMTRDEMIDKLESITMLEAEDVKDMNDQQLCDLLEEEYSVFELESRDLDRYITWTM